ncbi:MAG: hypothetical protein EAX95_15685 [Candidatus Thorarchaeota archaeon]|nr:hypothetical protein [Candidatus Thorarchaeota archaeon]
MIEGLRYGSNPLLEMRIQDIVLETDLNRQCPTGKNPDTRVGEQYQASGQDIVTFDNLMDEAAEAATANWLEQLWPTILISCSQQWNVATYIIITLTIDLLGQVNVAESNYQLGASYEYIMQQDPSLDETAIQILERIKDSTFAVTTAWTIASIAAGLAINLTMLGVFLVAFAAWGMLFWNWFCRLNVVLVNRVTNLEAANLCLEMTTRMILFALSVFIFTRVLSEGIEEWITHFLGPRVPWAADAAKWIMILTALDVVYILFYLYMAGMYMYPNDTFVGWPGISI